MKVSGKMIRLMVLEFFLKMMDSNMRETGLRTSKMAMVSSLLKMEQNTTAHSKRIE